MAIRRTQNDATRRAAQRARADRATGGDARAPSRERIDVGGLLRAAATWVGRWFAGRGSSTSAAQRETAGVARAAEQASQGPAGRTVTASIKAAVETVSVQRAFVPGTNVVATDPNQRAEIRPVRVRKGREHDPDATIVLSRQETEALRARAIASASGSTARPPPSSRESLQTLLSEAWQQRGQLVGKGSNGVYELYRRAVEPNPLSHSPQAYLGALATLAARRPPGAVSNVQGLGGGGDSISTVVEMHRKGQLPEAGPMSPAKVERSFFRFEREGMRPDLVVDRVYLNAAADTAPALMEHVVRRILDQPGRFPGVEMAKLAGPGGVGKRAENIVIYTRGAEASERVVDELRRVAAARPDALLSSVPKMTAGIAPGIALGTEPKDSGGQVSFGGLRSRAIANALQEAVETGLDEGGFRRLVDDQLRRANVDPARPHRNLS